MANILGKLLVELGINTGAFVGGLEKATYQMGKFGMDVQKTFRNLSNSVGNLALTFGALGPAGGAVATALAKMGQAAGAAIVHFSKINATFGLFAGGAAALGVAALSAAGSVIGLAIHASEGAAKLYALSQATGLNVPVLSGLGIVGRIAGVELEHVARAVERMGKNAFKSATGAVGVVDAFSRLKVSTRDVNGEIKNTDTLLFEISDKFSKMSDGPVKTGLAIALFGRAGAELIPVLNKGGDELRKWIDYGKSVGAVLSDEAAAGAFHFKEEMTKLELVFTGIQNKLMVALLPALTQMVDAFSVVLSQGTLIENFGRGVGEVLKTLTSWVLKAAYAWNWWGLQFEKLGAMMEEAGSSGFENLTESVKVAHRSISDINKDLEHINENLQTQLDALNKPFVAPVIKKQRDVADTSRTPGILEAIQARIKRLQDEAAAWVRVGESGSAAEVLIAEATKKGIAIFDELKAAAAKNPVAEAFVKSHEAAIKAAAGMAVYGEAIKVAITDVDKQTRELEQQAVVEEKLSAAYKEGGAVLVDALADKAFEKNRAVIQTLVEAHDRLMHGLAADVVVAKLLEPVISRLNAALEKNKAIVKATASTELTGQLNNQIRAFNALAPLVARLNVAYLQGESAVRAARIETELAAFVQEKLANKVVVTDEQLKQQRKILEDTAKQTLATAAAQEAAALNLGQLYKDEVEKINRIKEAARGNAVVQLLADVQLLNKARELNVTYGEALLKIGNLKEGFRGFLILLRERLTNPIEDLFKSLLTGIDGLEDKLAEFAVTGKADFKSLFQEFEKSILKSGFKNLFSKLAGGLLGKLGIETKADGSQSSPFHVLIDNLGLPGGLGGGAGDIFSGINSQWAKGPQASGGGIGGFLGGFGGIFSKIFGGLFGGGGGASASDLGGLSSSMGWFGGGLASGGGVMPGHAYIVGEEHPEFFVPKVPGTIVPSLTLGGRQSDVHVHFHGVVDHDSFKKNQAQIAAEFHRVASVAYARSQ
jgi:hypothetical protein